MPLRGWCLAACAVVLTTLPGCSGGDPAEAGAVDACEALSADVVADVVGEGAQEPVDGSTSTPVEIRQCSVRGTGEELLVTYFEPEGGAEQTRAGTAERRARCASPLPLQIDGADGFICSGRALGKPGTELRATWDEERLGMRIGILHEPGTDDPDRLRTVARSLMTTVTTSTFSR